MQIKLNGDSHALDAPLTLSELIARFNLTPQRVAIEVNQSLVKRADFTATTLKDGDHVEIVTLVGGG